MKKHTAVILGTAAVVGLTGVGMTTYAATQSSSREAMVEALASKFNLSKDEVQKFFDEQHTARQAKREANVKSELDQLVKDGSLTQEQVDKIDAKRAELQSKRTENRPASQPTEEQREAMRQKRESERTEIEAWLKDNNIPTKYRHYLTGGKGGEGGGHHRGERERNSQSD